MVRAPMVHIDADWVLVNHSAHVSLHHHNGPRAPYFRVFFAVLVESIDVFGQLGERRDDQVEVADDGKPRRRFEGLNLQEEVRGVCALSDQVLRCSRQAVLVNSGNVFEDHAPHH